MTLRNVPPYNPIHDLADKRKRYVEVGSQGVDRFPSLSVAYADLANLFRIQLCQSISFTKHSRMTTPAFLLPIKVVVGNRAFPQMSRVATRSVVARMADTQFIRKAIVRQSKSNPMGKCLTISPIAIGHTVALPFPTSVGIVRPINLRPEILNLFWGKCDRLRMHVGLLLGRLPRSRSYQRREGFLFAHYSRFATARKATEYAS